MKILANNLFEVGIFFFWECSIWGARWTDFSTGPKKKGCEGEKKTNEQQNEKNCEGRGDSTIQEENAARPTP